MNIPEYLAITATVYLFRLLLDYLKLPEPSDTAVSFVFAVCLGLWLVSLLARSWGLA